MSKTSEETGEASYILGIDGGGSKCRAILVSADGKELLGQGIAGPGNPVRGMDAAISSILDATRQALQSAGLAESAMADLVVGAGLAGVNLPQFYTLFRQWDHPFAEFHLTSDLHIACLGAHSGLDGGVIIIGTGSCGQVRSGDRVAEVGGHGFPHGDNGSGAWMGLQMLREVLLSMDRITPDTRLTQALLESCQCQDQVGLAQYFTDATPALYARHAPLVFEWAERGDACAQAIVDEAAMHISNMTYRLLEYDPARIALSGGLAGNIRPFLADDVQPRLCEPQAAPEWGAVWFAHQSTSEGARACDAL
ncbi:ATPase [Wenzhouxiangella sp. AB-CW3]|uniref:N-acetylglucosamine kinase n=1 Tax=Wenzhouxiangella sp. AB-CW3 TaxID=2771012 RepID=UPI00168B24EA|nr:BadF/BadG/BcrA/BcrD ATPase family protein [Wenzhouxiangella sp. AB-CW3]QOC21762.1 ATPase [Wenzhouxiangella sp. AB-CW3]